MKEKSVVVGITSGIAAYKALQLIRALRKKGCHVSAVMTKAATHMLPVSEVERATGSNVYTTLFDENFQYQSVLRNRVVEHIALADSAQIIVIAPATANIIAKLAHGIADDFLTTLVLAAHCPIILSPSMNVHMWKNPVTQNNIEALKKRGMIIIEPASGMLACGYEGQGRLPEIADIRDEVMRQLTYGQSLRGKKIMVTAGGTTEPIDDVRVMTNRSSGKMGIALAEECFLRGADVLLLRSKQSVEPRYHLREALFETTASLERLLKKHLPLIDCVFHTAAVSDFAVEKTAGKIASGKTLELRLTPQKKLRDMIKKTHPSVKLISFKAVWDIKPTTYHNVKEMLQRSKSDAVVINDVSRKDRGFQVDTNEVVVLTKNGDKTRIPLAQKRIIAAQIVTLLLGKKIL